MALATAAVLVARLFPPAFLAGHSQYFQQGDAGHHVLGWLAYARDSWHFPLMHTSLLNAPEGINIIFTDSIPLAALLLKPFAPLLSADFHYIGLWHAVAYAGQAVASVFLARALGLKSVFGSFMALAFALTWPPFTARFGHAALSTHALILFGIGVWHLGNSRQWSSNKACGWFAGLLLVALCVHAYLFAMLFALFSALLLQFWVSGERLLLQASRWALVMAMVVCVTRILGYWGTGDEGLTAGGFGFYSMNLLSPFCGGRLVRDCAFEGSGGQNYEGFNYLGAGALSIVAASLVLCAREWKALLRSHACLFAVFLLLFLFALSNQIYWGSRQLASVPLPDLAYQLASVFRASGRFFWPVGYGIFFFSLVFVLRQKKIYVAIPVVLALCLQWYDTSFIRAELMAKTRTPAAVRAQPGEEFANVAKLHVFPEFFCPPYDGQVEELLKLEKIALDLQLPINTAFTARGTGVCATAPDLGGDSLQPAVLYVVPPKFPGRTRLPPLLNAAVRDGLCGQSDEGLLCRKDFDRAKWLRIAEARKKRVLGYWNPAAGIPQTAVFPGVPDLGVSELQGDQMFGSGWSGPEPWGRWTDGNESTLTFPLRDGIYRSNYVLSIGGTAYFPDHDKGKGRSRTAEIYANGVLLAEAAFYKDHPSHLSVLIPAHLVGSASTLRITLRFNETDAPCNHTATLDCRQLALGLTALRLEQR